MLLRLKFVLIHIIFYSVRLGLSKAEAQTEIPSGYQSLNIYYAIIFKH